MSKKVKIIIAAVVAVVIVVAIGIFAFTSVRNTMPMIEVKIDDKGTISVVHDWKTVTKIDGYSKCNYVFVPGVSGDVDGEDAYFIILMSNEKEYVQQKRNTKGELIDEKKFNSQSDFDAAWNLIESLSSEGHDTREEIENAWKNIENKSFK